MANVVIGISRRSAQQSRQRLWRAHQTKRSRSCLANHRTAVARQGSCHGVDSGDGLEAAQLKDAVGANALVGVAQLLNGTIDLRGYVLKLGGTQNGRRRQRRWSYRVAHLHGRSRLYNYRWGFHDYGRRFHVNGAVWIIGVIIRGPRPVGVIDRASNPYANAPACVQLRTSQQ